MWHRLSHEGDCAYLRKKGVAAHGVRFTPSGNMALPLLDARGAIHGLQIIYADKAKKGRDKDFWPAGLAKKGHWFQIGSPDWICLVAEGYATPPACTKPPAFRLPSRSMPATWSPFRSSCTSATRAPSC